MFVRLATDSEFQNIKSIYLVGKTKYGNGQRFAADIFSDSSLSMIVMEDTKSFVEDYFHENEFHNVHFLVHNGQETFAMVENPNIFLGERERVRRFKYDPLVRNYVAPSISPMPPKVDRPLGMSAPIIKTVDVEVDNHSLPTFGQLEFLNDLPGIIGVMENKFNGKTINTTIRNGWAVREDGSFVITDAGEAAKQRVVDSSLENIVVELDNTSIPNDLQRETLKSLPMLTSVAHEKYSLRSLKAMMRKGWIVFENELYSITEAGKAALVREPEVVEKRSRSEAMKARWARGELGARAAKTEKPAKEKIDRSAAMKARWESGKMRRAKKKPSENVHTMPINENESLTFTLTAKQIEAFTHPKKWDQFHGKTKNFMVAKGWFTPNGTLTDLGQRIRSAL